jgi:hypothetical protein
MAGVFISYTRADSWYADKLYQHLHSFRVNDGGDVFLDRRDIDGGGLWRAELDQAIAGADACVVLLSSDYFTSQFCYEQELPAIARAHATRGTKVLPVLVRAVEWEGYAFGRVRLGDINAIGPFDEAGRLLPLEEFSAAIRERKFSELARRIELAVLGRPAREQPYTTPPAAAGSASASDAGSGAVTGPPPWRPRLWISIVAGVAMLATLGILGYQMMSSQTIVAPPVVPTTVRATIPDGGSTVDADCLDLDIRSPQQLPANLLRSISGQQSFPYWFRFKGRNACTHDVHLEVEFKIRGGPFVLVDREPYFRTLDRGQTIEENLPAQIEVTNDHLRAEDARLEINVLARDDHRVLRRDTHTIMILRRPMVVWDLRDAEDERVPVEFTLASLAAWTQVPSTELQALADQCRGNSASMTARNPDLWVPTCYEALFPERLAVSTESRSALALLERMGWQRILPADDILAAGVANPLEAGLALGAIGRMGLEDPRTNLGMIAVREDDDASAVLYFVWSRDQGPWSGVTLAEVAASGYATNKARADSAIQALLSRQPAIASALETADGIYVDQERRVVGINFRRAAEYYRIAGLP